MATGGAVTVVAVVLAKDADAFDSGCLGVFRGLGIANVFEAGACGWVIAVVAGAPGEATLGA